MVRIAAVLALSFPLPADQPPTSEQISRWVRQLGDNDFATRERASQLLWEAGEAAEAALTRAARSDDPEVARRARAVLDKFEWGVYPNTPKKVVGLISRYQGGDRNAKEEVVPELLQAGGPGLLALAKIAAAERDADFRPVLLYRIAQEAGRAVPDVLAEGNFAALEALTELGLAGGDETALANYVAFWLLRGRLDERVARHKAAAEKAGDKRDAVVLVHLYRAQGDLAAARRWAEKSGRAALLSAILFEQGDWKELARHEPETESGAPLERLGLRAAYHRLAGNRKEFDETVAGLSEVASGPDGDRLAGARALLLNDRPAEALALLAQGPHAVQAVEVLLAALKPREALELAERVRPAAGARQPELDVLRARALLVTGDREAALKKFDDLAEQIGRKGEAGWPEHLIDAEWRAGLKERADAHCARVLAASDDVGTRRRCLGKVFPTSADAAEVWWEFLRRRRPGDEPAAVMKQVRAAVEGRLAAKELTALAADAGRAAEGLAPAEREKWLRALADALLAAGLDDEGQAYLEKAAAVGVANHALIGLGDVLARRGQWERAAEVYGRAWDRDRKGPLPLFLRGRALAAAGRAEEGRRATEAAHWLPLGDEFARSAFANALVKRGHAEAARRERDLLARVSRPGSYFAGEAARLEANEALRNNDFLKAAEGHEKAMLRCLRPTVRFTEDSAYVGVPLFVHRLRARGLAAAGRADEALREVRACLELVPGHAELPIRLVPLLEKCGRKKEADELFGRVYEEHLRHCRDYPRSAALHNALAWLAANCRKNLGAALEHARKAVELEPENAGYLDTLAEVYFQRGNNDEAIKTMKKCLELSPTRTYYRKQLRRFEAGDASAELPDPTEGY